MFVCFLGIDDHLVQSTSAVVDLPPTGDQNESIGVAVPQASIIHGLWGIKPQFLDFYSGYESIACFFDK